MLRLEENNPTLGDEQLAIMLQMRYSNDRWLPLWETAFWNQFYKVNRSSTFDNTDRGTDEAAMTVIAPEPVIRVGLERCQTWVF